MAGPRISRFPAMQWYYSKNTTQMGPVSADELRAKLASGEVTGTDMAWREGMIDWRPVAAVDELRPALVRDPGAGPPVAATDLSSPYAPPAAAAGVVMPMPTSGLAIASLICGIMALVSCLFLPGIPAVICGHMALKRLADPGVRMSGRGMAIAGLIMGYFSLVVLAGFVLLILVGIFTA